MLNLETVIPTVPAEMSIVWKYDQINKHWELIAYGQFIGFYDSYEKAKTNKLIEVLMSNTKP
jgi:hypothetical protein